MVGPIVEPGGLQEPILRALRVCVKKSGRTIVRDVTLSVARGEVLGVLGPSGAGKSTFFGALVGEEPLSAGAVTLDGRDISSLPLWRRARLGLGYIPQSPSVLWELTVRENLQTFYRVARGTRVDDETVRVAAAKVDLLGQLEVKAGALSGGERRRLELGRALAANPRALICDEPFAGVDPRGAGRLGELLKDLAASGVAVLLADHHVDEALRVCTKAVLLLDGAVAALADPDSFRDHPLVRGRYLGTLHAP
jgi:lipopolysaccharide export system ATP-binding protein